MKKIVCGYASFLNTLDPKEYIIIEEDNQHISDKYVDSSGKKINEYNDSVVLKKGDVIIREFYYIWVSNDHIFIKFNKFKYYDIYRNSDELTPELKQSIRMKNSVFDFNHIKKRIVDLFSTNIKIRKG